MVHYPCTVSSSNSIFASESSGAPPIVLLEFRDFEFGRHYHVGEPGYVGEVYVPERVKALHELNLLLQVVNFATQLGITLLWFWCRWWPWWRWRPWWRNGVDVRVYFQHFFVGVFAIFSPLVSHFHVSLYHHVYEGEKIVKFTLEGSHPILMFIWPTCFSCHLFVCTDKILQANSNKLDFEITIGSMTPAYLVGKP